LASAVEMCSSSKDIGVAPTARDVTVEADPLIALARPTERQLCAYRPYGLDDSAVALRLWAPAFAVLSAEPSKSAENQDS
jgi:hypothetical protein